MIDAYLHRLGLPRQAPSAGYLFALHRAHVSKITYTNLEIMRGRPAGIAPEIALAEVLAARNGYCFHLNSAFAWLLRELGFSVTLHRGYVVRRGETEASLNHLALIVHDLGGTWFVDGGLGDAIYEPLPLVPGTYRQGPFTYELAESESRGGWRLEHDPTGSFGAMEFEAAGARIADFDEAHSWLSSSPDTPFKRFLVAQVREESRVLTVRGCTLLTVDERGTREAVIEDPREWLAQLTGMGLTSEGLLELWPAAWEGTQAWLAAR